MQGYGFSSVCFPPKIDLGTMTEENGAVTGFWRDSGCSVPLRRPLKGHDAGRVAGDTASII